MVRVLNCCISDFPHIYSDSKVVCFGAGKELDRIIDEYPGILQHIDCIADNNKSGEEYVHGDFKIKLVSFYEGAKRCKNSVAVIASVLYIDQMIVQLDGIDEMNGVGVYVPYLFDRDKLDIDSYRINAEPVIPKRIHYCWFGRNDIPAKFAQNIDTWKKWCPDYEIICWNEDNYDIGKCRYMQEAYDCHKMGFVPDYARLDIIYNYGGIYLDTDVELLKPLDELLYNDLFCGFESKKYIALGLGFGGKAGNPILKEMMDEYEKMSFVKEDGTYNLIASPVYQTETMLKHGLVLNGKYQVVDGCSVYPEECFAPVNIMGIGTPTMNSFSIHQYAGTWLDEDASMKKSKLIEKLLYVRNRIEL